MSVEVFSKLAEIPTIHSALSLIITVHEEKKQNYRIYAAGTSVAARCMQMMHWSVQLLPLKTPIGKMDSLACAAVDTITTRFPSVMIPPEKIVEISKLYAQNQLQRRTESVASYKLAQMVLLGAERTLETVEKSLRYTLRGTSTDLKQDLETVKAPPPPSHLVWILDTSLHIYNRAAKILPFLEFTFLNDRFHKLINHLQTLRTQVHAIKLSGRKKLPPVRVFLLQSVQEISETFTREEMTEDHQLGTDDAGSDTESQSPHACVESVDSYSLSEEQRIGSDCGSSTEYFTTPEEEKDLDWRRTCSSTSTTSSLKTDEEFHDTFGGPGNFEDVPEVMEQLEEGPVQEVHVIRVDDAKIVCQVSSNV